MKFPTIESTFKFFGESKHGATIVVCSIALFKGIFRPIFTMMDKKSDPETKKYAAVREGLTELVALPIYAVTPSLVEKFIVDKVFKGKTPEVKKVIQTNAKFLTLCAATLLIPAVCNWVQPPVMAAYKKKQDAKKLDITSTDNSAVANIKPAQTAIATGSNITQLQTPTPAKANYGMKVGG